MNTNKIPFLTTERLLLRPFKLTDAKDVQRLAGSMNPGPIRVLQKIEMGKVYGLLSSDFKK